MHPDLVLVDAKPGLLVLFPRQGASSGSTADHNGNDLVWFRCFSRDPALTFLVIIVQRATFVIQEVLPTEPVSRTLITGRGFCHTSKRVGLRDSSAEYVATDKGASCSL
jgi:hypothetical protein